MRRIAVILAVILALGAAGFFVARRGAVPVAPVATNRQAPAATPAPTPAAEPVAAQNLPGPFGFLRVTTDLSHAQPAACLHFSRLLSTDPSVHYGDWLKLTPKPDAALTVDGDALCVAGLSLGRIYKAAIAAGLPAADGAKLDAAAQTVVDFGDKAKLVAFPGRGYILSRNGSAGVTLDTVNVEHVAVEVLRVNDRLAPKMIDTIRQNGDAAGYTLEQLADNSARSVWSGVMDVQGPHNEIVHSAFPLADAVQPRQPGVYLLVAANAQGLEPRTADKKFLWQRSDEYEFAAQWVVETDLALTTVTATDGLHVFVRSLSSANPVAGVEIQLLARDSIVLGQAKTDAIGQAIFAPGLLRGTGAASAASVVAYGSQQDFALYDLTQPGFDLSDRGVAGREDAGAQDAFVYTDRGIYRPGESVHAMALLRDRVAQAIEGVPLTLALRKPNGVVFKRAVLPAQPGGGFRLDVDLPDTASRGLWSVEAQDADGTAIGHAAFEVQDFVPQRLKVSARSDATKLALKDSLDVAIDGRFLYGAPAGGLEAEGQVVVALDPAPFPQSAQGYRFGIANAKFPPQEVALTPSQSDAQGHAKVQAALDIKAPDNVLLKATITAGLSEPGGRVTSDSFSLPIRSAGLSVGVRPRFKDGVVREGDPAAFELIAVDADGKPQAAKLHWTLIEERVNYDWFQTGTRWNYHRSVVDKIATAGDAQVTPDQVASLSPQVGWGSYRLVVEAPGNVTTVLPFHAGWAATDDTAETPDKVEITAEQPHYAVGQTARLHIVPPFAGKIRLMVARDKLFETREIDAPKDGVTVEVPVSADWGSGAYVLASLYRPADGGRGHLPVRAIGTAWIGIDPGQHQMGVSLTLPDKVAPRQRVTLPVKIQGGVPGEPVYLTLAAVDEGILQLTRFASPDPGSFYFGQRRLDVEIGDDYGRLLDGTEGAAAKLRSGGDAFGGKGLPVVPTRSVALFQGPLTLGADGTASVPIEIPDFEGELRVMAVAFSRSAVGQGAAPLTVRDPVVEDVALPRFLAPGDEGHLTLLVDNTDGAAGTYHVAFTATGAARVVADKPVDLTLAKAERKDSVLPIIGLEEGEATVSAQLTGPGGLSITRSWSIAVRGAHYPITLENTALQAAGTSFALDKKLLAAFVPGSVSASISYSRLAGIDTPGLLQSLWRYPYGCTEQLVSTSFPLLYYDDPGFSARAADKAEVRHRVQAAIERVLDRQDPDGLFGLWRAGDHLGSDWLALYTLDFLLHARAAGYDVPDGAIERGYLNAESWFRDVYHRHAGDESTLAYAGWLLAPAHRVDLGRLRQTSDGVRNEPTFIAWTPGAKTGAAPLSLAQLSGSLAVLGDRSRATNTLRLAVADIAKPYTADWWVTGSYWSKLRDAAALISIAAESDQLALAQPLLPELQKISRTPERLTTQEKAWLLSATHAVTLGDKELGITLNGQPLPSAHGQAALLPSGAEIAAGLTLTMGPQDLWRSVTVHGAPVTAPPAMSEGLTLAKTYLAMDGSPLDPANLTQNQRFIVLLVGKAQDKAVHHLALVDMLPAGVEIEAALKPEQAPAFLGQLTVLRARESRDDRFVAALDIGGDAFADYNDGDDTAQAMLKDAKAGLFRAAYVARAVTLGSFALPEAVVEDMYRPGVMARTAAGQTKVGSLP